MQRPYRLKMITFALCAGVFTCASAHPFLTPIAEHHNSSTPYYAGEPIDQMLFSMPQSDGNPKLWTEMSAKERAEIWPFLSPKMQRYYWRSMTEPERRAMRAEFSPSINEKFRKRYVSPAECDGHVVRHRLSPEERAQMRQQIREMHIEYYRFRHQRAPMSAAESQSAQSTQPATPAE